MLVVITDCDHPDTAIERRIFAEAGIEVRQAACRTEDDVLAAGAGAAALLVQYAPVSEKVLAGLPALQAVGRYGTGLDPIDVPAAAARGVEIVSVRDYAVQEVSDHTIALTLALCRRVVAYSTAVRAGRWGLTATLRFGVIGLGLIGQTVARKAAALGFDVVGYDVVKPPAACVPLVSMEELLSTSDIVSLHVPLTAQTRHLINGPRLALMRSSAALVNTSRGGVVDQAALGAAIASGELGGAALDVLDPEPPSPADPLVLSDRVIITPHVAFYSEESLAELKRRAAEGIVSALTRH
jgi:D-3-phosphoglycerate dehydrogenase / 2-oxoglutarate reductase